MGRVVTYRIVGEDEAEPDQGRIAWTTPVEPCSALKSVRNSGCRAVQRRSWPLILGPEAGDTTLAA